jgi:hypothetical protein
METVEAFPQEALFFLGGAAGQFGVAFGEFPNRLMLGLHRVILLGPIFRRFSCLGKGRIPEKALLMKVCISSY